MEQVGAYCERLSTGASCVGTNDGGESYFGDDVDDNDGNDGDNHGHDGEANDEVIYAAYGILCADIEYWFRCRW